jgi:hypothetical protein
MSLRVDLYPLRLPNLVALFGADGWERGRALVDEMRADPARRLDESLLDELLSGRLRASQPEAESGALAALIARLAYRLREPSLEVLFDIGNVWNALESRAPKLEGETKRLVRSLLDGRPLIGARIDSDWNTYAWLAARELRGFDSLVDDAEVHAWLEPVIERELDVFVAIG